MAREINPLTGKPWPKRTVVIRNIDGTIFDPKKPFPKPKKTKKGGKK